MAEVRFRKRDVRALLDVLQIPDSIPDTLSLFYNINICESNFKGFIFLSVFQETVFPVNFRRLRRRSVDNEVTNTGMRRTPISVKSTSGRRRPAFPLSILKFPIVSNKTY